MAGTNGFVQLRRGILEHLHAMTGNELKVYIALLCLADHRTGKVCIGLSDLCEIVELPKSSVSAALRSLAGPHNSKGTKYITYTPASNQFGLTSVLVLKHQKNPCSDGLLFGSLDGTCTSPVQHTPSDLRKQAPNNQKKVEEKTYTSATSKEPKGFDEFWEAYPKKAGKGAARTAFAKAAMKIDLPSLLLHVERYKTFRAVREGYVCNPATWLNQERWGDEDAPDPKRERRAIDDF